MPCQYRGRADDPDLAGLWLGDDADRGRAQLQGGGQPRPRHRLLDTGQADTRTSANCEKLGS